MLSLFTIAPLIFCCNDDEETFLRLLFEGRFVFLLKNLIKINLIKNLRALNKQQFFARRIASGSVLGAFCGTIVIPLDWDVYWQVI